MSPATDPGDPDRVLADLRAQVEQIQTSPAAGRARGPHAARADAAGAGGPPEPTSSGAAGTDGTADADADPEAVARAIVLRRLTGQARTRTELERALARKQVPDPVAASVLDRMEEVGLVDDAAFALSWVESRQQRRHLSRSALRRELRAKGVDPEHVESAVAEVDPGDEYAAACDLARRKLPQLRRVDPDKARRRLAGALERRGFGSGLILRVIADVTAETPDQDA